MATDNSDVGGKIAVREWALARVGGARRARVVELFGGEGVLHDLCYREVARHVSIEKRAIPGPNRLVGDNRALLPRLVNDGDGWNLFDADAYANPWLVLADVCRLRAPGRFAFVATCGIGRSLKTGLANTYVRRRIGLRGVRPSGLLIRWYDDIVRWILADWRRFGARVTAAVRTGSPTGPHGVCYWAFDVVKDGTAEGTQI